MYDVNANSTPSPALVPRLGHVGEWYNNWGDFTGDIADAGKWLWNFGHNTQQAGTAVQNAGNNASNLTSSRVNVTTIAMLAVGGFVVYDLLSRRRS